MIHDREAHDDVLAILDAEGAPERVIFSCFSGDAAMARRCADSGYVMSFAGNVTFGGAGDCGGGGGARQSDPGGDRRAVPELGAEPGEEERACPGRAHAGAVAELRQMDVAELCAAGRGHGRAVYGPWSD